MPLPRLAWWGDRQTGGWQVDPGPLGPDFAPTTPVLGGMPAMAGRPVQLHLSSPLRASGWWADPGPLGLDLVPAVLALGVLRRQRQVNGRRGGAPWTPSFPLASPASFTSEEGGGPVSDAGLVDPVATAAFTSVGGAPQHGWCMLLEPRWLPSLNGGCCGLGAATAVVLVRVLAALALCRRCHHSGCHGWPAYVNIQSLGENLTWLLWVDGGGVARVILPS